jgi:hypothetical protein
MAALRTTMASEDAAAIQAKVSELSQALQKVGASMYQQPDSTPPPSGEAEAQEPEEPKGPEDDVVDGEFRQA